MMSSFDTSKAIQALRSGMYSVLWGYVINQNVRYKALGATVVDANGNLDTIEFLNISKDDALAFPRQAHRGYPAPITEQMTSTIAPFVRKASDIINSILHVFNDRLELPLNFLSQKLHPSTECSSSEVRWTRNPAGNKAGGLAMGAHTDFGSLNLLFNELGGLQVLPVGMEEWQYVKVCIYIF